MKLHFWFLQPKTLKIGVLYNMKWSATFNGNNETIKEQSRRRHARNANHALQEQRLANGRTAWNSSCSGTGSSNSSSSSLSMISYHTTLCKWQATVPFLLSLFKIIRNQRHMVYASGRRSQVASHCPVSCSSFSTKIYYIRWNDARL